MNNKYFLQEMANNQSGGAISIMVREAIMFNEQEQIIKTLKSMVFDNEKLMIKCYGKIIVNQIKSA